MTTIKTPNTVSHSKSTKGSSFATFLILLTWLAVGAGFYGVKMGLIQPDEINPEVNAKLTGIETKVTAIETKLNNLEKRITEASSALTPAAKTETPATSEIAKPETSAKPEENKPAAPAAPAGAVDAKKPEGTAATPPSDPILTDPKEVKPEDKAAPTKPQSRFKDKNHKEQTALLEKKN